MAQDREREEEQRAWDTAAATLRQELARFAREDRFAADFAAGIRLFWDGHYTVDSAGLMNEDEALRFFDWFAVDYPLTGGTSLLEAYAAGQADTLDERSRALVTAWREARPASAWEITAVERPRLQLRDLFTSEELWVDDAAAARELTLGEVLLARVLPAGDVLRLAAGAARLPRDEAQGLVPQMQRAWDAYIAENPAGTHDQFLHARGHLLTHYALQQAVAHGRPAVHPEGMAGAVKNRAARQFRRFVRR